MDDLKIIQLYINRDENAIKETESVYGNKLNRLSFGIVKNFEDAKECVNDTYFKVWNSIPPHNPKYFFAFISKICRYICFGNLDYKKAKKRNFQVVSLSDELLECIPDNLSLTEIDYEMVGNILSSFLKTLPEEPRLIFMRRYWFANSILEISERFFISESKVKTSLFRTRSKLKVYLEKEGIYL